MDISTNLAAAYYAATLTADPTLYSHPDAVALAAYESACDRLASALLNPAREVTIRCETATRSAHPDRFAKALVRVHNQQLLIARIGRGEPELGIRREVHALIDLSMAQNEGHSATSIYCQLCGSLHTLGFKFLRKAQTNDVSDRREQYHLNPLGDPTGSDDKALPDDPQSVDNEAFAITTGTIDGISPLFVHLPFWRAMYYKERFGLTGAHDAHFDRLIGRHHPVGGLEHPTMFRTFAFKDRDAATTEIRRVEEAHR